MPTFVKTTKYRLLEYFMRNRGKEETKLQRSCTVQSFQISQTVPSQKNVQKIMNNDVNVFSTLELQGDGYFSLVTLGTLGLDL